MRSTNASRSGRTPFLNSVRIYCLRVRLQAHSYTCRCRRKYRDGLVFWRTFAITAVPRIAADRLGGMAESSHKRATHPLSVDKSGFHGNDFHWMTAVLHHNPCGFQSKLFDGLGRRLSCLGSKGPAKLTRA